jgi:adenylate cyclase
MDYTMMGDSVNLAARSEGVNKEYKTYTMISQFTYEQAKDHIETRELDLIRVVGKNEPIIIYEVLGAKGQMDDKIREILPHFNQGIIHYRNWNWEDGIACFEKALSIDGEDGPSGTYLKRCKFFLETPPNNDWDGVYSMQSK